MHGFAHRHRAQRVQALGEGPREAGMCCVIRIAGLSGGRGWSTSRIASVPPVDAPITSFSELESGGARRPARPRRVRRRRAQLGARGGADLVGDDLGVFEQAVPDAQLGLGDEVDGAQFQRAQRDFAAALGQDDTITTGMGAGASAFRKSSPSMRGISTSSVSTSGLWRLIGAHQRIGRGRDDLHVRLAVDDLCHQAAHQRGIVHTKTLIFCIFAAWAS